MVTRRDFLKKAGIAVAATAILPPMKFKKNALKKIGLILYTVRQDMQKDPDGTLKAVAEMGYSWIEAANYSNGLFYNMKPAGFRKKVESYGMKLVSSHSSVKASNIDKAVADSAEAGLKYLILPSLPADRSESLDGYMQAADFFNLAGEKCKNAGIKFGFHNHSREFVRIDDRIPYDILVENTDPKLVTFELDLCWITAGGQSMTDYIFKYPGRFELWHVKDMTADKRDATLGEGIIDFKPIFALAKKSGMKYSFVEQDDCRTHTPIESAKISRQYLIKNL